MTELIVFGGQTLGTLFFSFAALHIWIANDRKDNIIFRFIDAISVQTYGFGFFVGSGEFIAFIFKTTELDLEFMVASGNFRDGWASFTQFIWLAQGEKKSPN